MFSLKLIHEDPLLLRSRLLLHLSPRPAGLDSRLLQKWQVMDGHPIRVSSLGVAMALLLPTMKIEH
jgi:hypothetical protein